MAQKRLAARTVVDDLKLMEELGKDKVFFDEMKLGRIRVGFIGLYHGTDENRMGERTEAIMMDILSKRKGPVYAETSVLETSSLLLRMPDRVVPIDTLTSLWGATLGLLKSHKAPHIFPRLETERIEEKIRGLPPREEGDVKLTMQRYPAQRYDEESYWGKYWGAIMNENLIRRFSGDLFGDRVDEGSFFKAEVLYLRGRSLLMASEVADDLKKRDPPEASVVQGMDHMSETIHFLKNPAIAIRYAQRLQYAFRFLIDDSVRDYKKPEFYWDMEKWERERYRSQVENLLQDIDKAVKTLTPPEKQSSK
ncbi:MAG: hypothetical protein V1875_09095 [Candidatus Altiarchaeota archaeon]